MSKPDPKYMPGDMLDFALIDGGECRLVVRKIYFDGRIWQYELEEVDPDELHATRGKCKRCLLISDKLLGGICGNCADDLRDEADADRLAR